MRRARAAGVSSGLEHLRTGGQYAPAQKEGIQELLPRSFTAIESLWLRYGPTSTIHQHNYWEVGLGEWGATIPCSAACS